MLGAYFGVLRCWHCGLNFWLAALGAGLGVGAVRRSARAAGPAPACRQPARPGAGDARHLLHHRRRVPAGLGRRPDAGADAAESAAAAASSFGFAFPTYRLVVLVHRAGRGDRALSADGAHAARRHDPRRRRRHGDGARRSASRCRGCSPSCSASARRSPAPAACSAGRSSSAYPGLDADMLPLALIVVILGGVGSLLGAFVGSFIIGFIYTFGIALFPDLAYVDPVPADDPGASRSGRRACSGGSQREARHRIGSSSLRVRCSRCRASSPAILRQPGEPDPDLRDVRARASTCWSATAA